MQTNKRPLVQPTQKCNPANPGFDNSMISVTVTGRGNLVRITFTDSACGQSNTRSVEAPYQVGTTFGNVFDFHPSTFKMLNGLADRFYQFQLHGFDSEP